MFWGVKLFRSMQDKCRAASWLVLAVVFAGALWATGGQVNLGVLAWKGLLLSFAAFLGYWLDRTLFPGARPHQMKTVERKDQARFRRAIIVAAVVIAAAVGI